MTEHWQRVNEVLDAVLEHEGAERDSVLAQACAGDEILRREVESLLCALGRAGVFMEEPPVESVSELFDGGQFVAGQTIGPYRVLSEIGRGGMGTVYLAERADEAYSKVVAIKLMRLGPFYQEGLRRFRLERQILANLDHPNIAHLLDGGTIEHGLPYVVMEHVAGIPITDYCDEHKLSITERLRLFRTVCSAVQFAHQHLIVHRDLKPANILVTDDGTVKLLDFGIAKLLGPDVDAAGAGLTRTGMHLLTPDYASPEQVRGDAITVASDVYSLGVLLYELLTGHLPYRPKTNSLLDVEAAVCDAEPEWPSAVVGRVTADGRPGGAAGAGLTPEGVSRTREGRPERLRARLRGDLDRIVLMALRKDARQRYRSAEQLSEDIRRHLEGQPVVARKPTLTYRAGKFLRRHRVAVPAVAVFVLTLMGGVVMTMWQAHIATTHARENRRLLYIAQMNLAGQAWDEANLERVRELLEGNRPGRGEEDFRGFEWYYLWRLYHGGSDHLTMRHGDGAWKVVYSPDGRKLASCSEDMTAKVWDAATGRELLTLAGHTKWVNGVAFSPDGGRLATASGDATARLWDAGTGELLATFGGHTARVNAAVFSSNGRKLFTGGDDRLVKVWDTATGREVASFKGHGTVVRSLALSPDGNILVTAGGEGGRVKLWDANTRELLRTLAGHKDWVASVKFTPDGMTLATAGYDHVAKLWDAATGRELAALKGHNGRIPGVDFSPDGRRVATASDDRTIKLWDADTGQELASLKGHLRAVESVAFSPDGRTLASAGLDQTIKLWHLADTGEAADILSPERQITQCVAYSPEGGIIAAGHVGGITLWDADGGRVLRATENTSVFHSLAFSPDGRSLAAGDREGGVMVLGVFGNGEPAVLRGHAGVVNSIAYSPDGRMIATGSFDNTVRLWDAATRREVASFKPHEDRVFSLAFSPDGRTLATGGGDRRVRLWDVASVREIATLNGHGYWVHAVAFSPDGGKLASGSGDLTVKLWDLAGRRELMTLKGHSGNVTSVAFSHDGRRLATGSYDASVRLWDISTGQELLRLRGHTDFVESVAFSPDGRTLVSGSRDRTVRLWRASGAGEAAARD